jgi:two-component system NtrC family sensor kinase
MDNGHGMSEDTMRQIFEPFFTTKKGYGTGLGLSITYGIIKKLGGEIKVDSKLNQGTTFTVLLPKTSPGDSENE